MTLQINLILFRN